MPVQLAQFLFEQEPQLSSVPWQKAQGNITANEALLNLTGSAWLIHLFFLLFYLSSVRLFLCR